MANGKLKEKMRLFARYYVQGNSILKSAELAGYKNPDVGYYLVEKPEIKEYMDSLVNVDDSMKKRAYNLIFRQCLAKLEFNPSELIGTNTYTKVDKLGNTTKQTDTFIKKSLDNWTKDELDCISILETNANGGRIRLITQDEKFKAMEYILRFMPKEYGESIENTDQLLHSALANLAVLSGNDITELFNKQHGGELDNQDLEDLEDTDDTDLD